MPIVPYNADLGYQRDTASTKPREESYSVQAEALQTFTKGAMAFGGVIADVDQKIKADRESVYRERAGEQARRDSAENIGKVIVDPNTAHDGSNFFEQYGKFNEESKKKFLEQIPDADEYLKAKLDTHMNNIISQSYDTALRTRLDYQKDAGEKLRFGQQNSMASDVYKNPFEAERIFNRYSKSIEESPTMAPFAKANTIYSARQKAAGAAINSFLDGKQYSEASKVLDTFKEAFSDTEAAARRKEISDRRFKDLDILNKEDDNTEKRTFLQLKSQQSTNFSRYLKDADQVKDPVAPGYATSLDGKLKAIETDQASGLLSLDHATILKAIYKNEPVESDPNVQSDLMTRLMKKDVSGLEGSIAAAVGNQQISGSEAAQLIKELNSTRQSLGPNMQLSDNDKFINSLVDEIPSMVARPESAYSATFEREDKAKAKSIKTEFYEKLKTSPLRGNPRALLDSIVDKYVVPVYPTGVPPLNGTTVLERKHDAKDRYDSGQISAKDYKVILRVLRVEERQEKRNRARKDGN